MTAAGVDLGVQRAAGRHQAVRRRRSYHLRTPVPWGSGGQPWSRSMEPGRSMVTNRIPVRSPPPAGAGRQRRTSASACAEALGDLEFLAERAQQLEQVVRGGGAQVGARLRRRVDPWSGPRRRRSARAAAVAASIAAMDRRSTSRATAVPQEHAQDEIMSSSQKVLEVVGALQPQVAIAMAKRRRLRAAEAGEGETAVARCAPVITSMGRRPRGVETRWSGAQWVTARWCRRRGRWRGVRKRRGGVDAAASSGWSVTRPRSSGESQSVRSARVPEALTRPRATASGQSSLPAAS